MNEKLKLKGNTQNIFCVGKDRLLHLCKPSANKTNCGVEVLTKKPTPQELERISCCYKCTF
jgi:hypothetical protein